MALFLALPVIWLAPFFFNKKYMHDPIFQDSYVKGPIFLTSWSIHIFFAQRFFEAVCSLGIQWIDCDICLTTSNKWVQTSKDSIWIGQHFRRSSISSKARYMNGVGFEILTRTLIPQSPLSSHLPPLPTPPLPHPRVQDLAVSQVFLKRLIWNFNIVNIRQSMHVAFSFNWAFSGSLYGLGRKREFRCFSPVSENHSYSRRNSNVL